MQIEVQKEEALRIPIRILMLKCNLHNIPYPSSYTKLAP